MEKRRKRNSLYAFFVDATNPFHLRPNFAGLHCIGLYIVADERAMLIDCFTSIGLICTDATWLDKVQAEKFLFVQKAHRRPEEHGDADVRHVATDGLPRLGDDEHLALGQRNFDRFFEFGQTESFSVLTGGRPLTRTT